MVASDLADRRGNGAAACCLPVCRPGAAGVVLSRCPERIRKPRGYFGRGPAQCARTCTRTRARTTGNSQYERCLTMFSVSSLVSSLPDLGVHHGAGDSLQPLPGLDHGRALPRSAVAELDRAAGGHGPAELETICALHAHVQHVDVRLRVCRPVVAAAHAAQPGRQGHVGAHHDVQLRDLVPHEHQPAALLGRAAPFLFQPVVLRVLEHVPLRERGLLRPGGDHPRAPQRPAHGQLLPRHVAGLRLYVRAHEPDHGRAAAGRRHPHDARRQRQGGHGRAGGDGQRRQGPAQPSRRSRAARWPPSFPSSIWAPTAAGSSGPIRRTPTRTPARGATSSRS